MLSENVEPENNIRNKVFCDSEGNLVGLLVYLIFGSQGTWRKQYLPAPFAKAVT